MSFVLHPEAETEFNEAVEYYEKLETGLGYDLAIEIYSTIQRIVAFPKAWPIIDSDIRRSLVNRFPYGILYSVENEVIYIVAIMNLHRDPEYWKSRK